MEGVEEEERRREGGRGVRTTALLAQSGDPHMQREGHPVADRLHRKNGA